MSSRLFHITASLLTPVTYTANALLNILSATINMATALSSPADFVRFMITKSVSLVNSSTFYLVCRSVFALGSTLLLAGTGFMIIGYRQIIAQDRLQSSSSSGPDTLADSSGPTPSDSSPQKQRSNICLFLGQKALHRKETQDICDTTSDHVVPGPPATVIPGEKGLSPKVILKIPKLVPARIMFGGIQKRRRTGSESTDEVRLIKQEPMKPTLGTDCPDFAPQMFNLLLRKIKARTFLDDSSFQSTAHDSGLNEGRHNGSDPSNQVDNTQIFMELEEGPEPSALSAKAFSAELTRRRTRSSETSPLFDFVPRPKPLVYKGVEFVPLSVKAGPAARAVERPSLPPVPPPTRLSYTGHNFVPWNSRASTSVSFVSANAGCLPPSPSPKSAIRVRITKPPSDDPSTPLPSPPVTPPRPLEYKGQIFVPSTTTIISTAPKISSPLRSSFAGRELDSGFNTEVKTTTFPWISPPYTPPKLQEVGTNSPSMPSKKLEYKGHVFTPKSSLPLASKNVSWVKDPAAGVASITPPDTPPRFSQLPPKPPATVKPTPRPPRVPKKPGADIDKRSSIRMPLTSVDMNTTIRKRPRAQNLVPLATPMRNPIRLEVKSKSGATRARKVQTPLDTDQKSLEYKGLVFVPSSSILKTSTVTEFKDTTGHSMIPICSLDPKVPPFVPTASRR